MPAYCPLRYCFWFSAFLCVAISAVWAASHWTYVWAAPAGRSGNYGVYAVGGMLHYTGTRTQPTPYGWPSFGIGTSLPPCAMNWH